MIERLKHILKLQKDLYGLDGLYIDKKIYKESYKENKESNIEDKVIDLSNLKESVQQCKKCALWKTRVNVVFGEGDINAELMFVGEGPGYEEDKQGRPFVGKAGELLTKIINAMKLKREKVYITNIVKCHPLKTLDPYLRNNDRPPTEEEIQQCYTYLERQIEIIKPKVICCLGSTAAKVLTKNDVPITELRGKIFKYKNTEINVIPTYHPAALLRNPSLKKLTWQDMQLVMKVLGVS